MFIDWRSYFRRLLLCYGTCSSCNSSDFGLVNLLYRLCNSLNILCLATAILKIRATHAFTQLRRICTATTHYGFPPPSEPSNAKSIVDCRRIEAIPRQRPTPTTIRKEQLSNLLKAHIVLSPSVAIFGINEKMHALVTFCFLWLSTVTAFGPFCPTTFGGKRCGLHMSSVAEAPTNADSGTAVETLR